MGKAFHSTRRVWVWHKSCWKQGARASTSTASKVRVLVDGDSKTIDVARKHVCPIKHNGKRASRTSTKVVPIKAQQPRPVRFRVKTIEVEGVAYEGGNRHGDYSWHLQPQQQDDPKYGRALHIYNENMTQQNDKASTGSGAGNACARPHRAHGRAIGMPTGHYGGFSSMDEWCDGFNCTAKAGIDLATTDIVTQVCDNIDRYDRIYYCFNAGDQEKLIGMGVFHINDSVRKYITKQICDLSSKIAQRQREQRRAERI